MTPSFVLGGGGDFYRVIVTGGGFLPLRVVSSGFVPGGGVILDEIDSCINSMLHFYSKFQQNTLILVLRGLIFLQRVS